MKTKWSILIPSTEIRRGMTMELVDEFLDQIESNNLNGIVEVVTLFDNGESSIGKKRNELMELAKGEYISFFDSDDKPSNVYVSKCMEGISQGVDCCSLKGVITWDGTKPELFEHSLKYNEYKTTENDIKYERYPNHLNCIKKSLIFDFKFPEINHGEDTDFATQIHKANVLKNEYYIEEIMYHYKFLTSK